MRDYRVFVLTPDGTLLDCQEVTCSDVEEVKAQAKVLAQTNPVEVWEGPTRVAQFTPADIRKTASQ